MTIDLDTLLLIAYLLCRFSWSNRCLSIEDCEYDRTVYKSLVGPKSILGNS